MSQLKIKDGNNWINIPASGVGVPSGGTTGQVLVKTSGTDYDTAWVNQKLIFNNVQVATSSFVSDATYTDYPYRASVTLTNVTSSMYPQVTFNLIDAISGTYAPIAETYNGGIYIYATQVPSIDMLIPTIICFSA